jgi:hypothetical protein
VGTGHLLIVIFAILRFPVLADADTGFAEVVAGNSPGRRDLD